MDWRMGVRASVIGVTALTLGTGCVASTTANMQPTDIRGTALVFDHVTVVDVDAGALVPDQRVVIVGDRIRAVGRALTVQLPAHAQLIDAQGKFLIPGLWDMHISPSRAAERFYPRLLAYGITGIRDAGAPIPLDTLRLWRREILEGRRIGPPRQLLAPRVWEWEDKQPPCFRNPPPEKRSDYIYVCVNGADHARRVIDSLKSAGVDMITVTGASHHTYFAMLSEARRVGLPFGGKDGGGDILTESDSGERIIDDLPKELAAFCTDSSASMERCQPVADRLRRNDTWVTAQDYARSTDNHNTPTSGPGKVTVTSSLRIAERANVPLLAMSYVRGDYPWEQNLPGSTLHETLADFVARGLTPIAALRSATLNPAKMLHATDSLGTVATGKLADLVLLDADPLANITNTTTIRAVVANGRYFDRAALDELLAETQAKANAKR